MNALRTGGLKDRFQHQQPAQSAHNGGDGAMAPGPTRRDDEVHDHGNRAWGVVAVREIIVKLTDRNFLIGTAFTLVLLLGVTAFNAFMASRESVTTVAVVDQAGAGLVRTAGDQLKAIDDMSSLRATSYADDAAARAAVKAGDAAAYLHRDPTGWVLTSESKVNDRVATVLGSTVRERAMQANLAAAGTSWAQVTKDSQLRTDQLSGPQNETEAQSQAIKLVTGIIFAALFYMAALMFGMGIAQSVVEEKQSRVVEILATAIPIRQLLIGKVLGNTALALAQMVLYVGAGLIALSFTQYRSFLSMLTAPALWFLVFFLVGFLSLACVWAVAGSLASRSEDLQSTTMPMTFLLVIVLFAGMSASGTWLVISSYLPVISTITMPMRLMDGSASWWEAAISLAITMAFAFGTVVVGERLYRRSVMQTGGRMSLRQTLRTAD